MRSKQATVRVAGGLVLLLALLLYGQVDQFGFPDGHLTDVERALRPLGYVFVGLSIPVGVSLLLAGRQVGPSQAARYCRALLIGYALITLLLVIAWVYVSYRLDDGVGG